MRLKKLQWIRKPEKVKINSSKSISIETQHDCALCYTFDLDEKVNVNILSDNLIYGLGIIFNKDQGMSLICDGEKLIKTLTFMGIEEKTNITLFDKNNFSFEKKGDKVIFFNGEKEVVSISFKSIMQSVTVAIVFYNKGIANINF